ncbi:SA1362 family protein [Lentibacillus salinarum]|uniref:SA1362 family protein n=1 Tax=Lentibacillus salinarum TaxID=446820 RepID=A0ABW3ZR73_9BACI
MAKNKGSLLVYAIIGLAIIGVITQLFSNTASFLTTVLTMLGFGVVVSALLYVFLFRKRQPTNDSQKYKQAVKQSKAKYSQQQAKPTTTSKRPSSFSLKKKSAKRTSHLRVIDGNKSKRKNRASF